MLIVFSKLANGFSVPVAAGMEGGMDEQVNEFKERGKKNNTYSTSY